MMARIGKVEVFQRFNITKRGKDCRPLDINGGSPDCELMMRTA
jgi:hypothetical protein